MTAKTNRDAPQYYLAIQAQGSNAQRVDASDRVLSYEFEDNESKADVLKISLDNHDLALFDDPLWAKGNKIFSSWGYPGNMAPERELVVEKITGGLTLNVEARALSMTMNKVTKTRAFENMSRSDVARKIAKEYGYEGDKVDVEDTEGTHEHLAQARLTDAQFLKRLADKEGFEFYVDFDGFHFHKRRVGKKPVRVLSYFVLEPVAGDITSFSIENDVTAKPGKVKLKGKDPVTKKEFEVEGSHEKTERDVMMPTPEVVDPKTGEITQEKLVATEDVRPTTATSAKEAKKHADAAFRKAQQTTVKMSIEMVGDPGIVAKSVVEVRGMGRRLSGLYYVTQANHKLGSNGYALSLKIQTDGSQGHPEKPKPKDGKANVNPNAGKPADPDALEEVINEKTGEGTYVHTSGRQK